MTERPPIVAKATTLFAQQFGSQPTLTSWGPGRINLIGGHTDYNQGLAMPTAIDRWIAVAFRPRADKLIQVKSVDFDGLLVLDPRDSNESTVSWHRYIRGAIETYAERTEHPGGFDALFLGDVPSGAGLSSSAALLVGWMNGLRALGRADFDDWELVKLCQSVEHRFLGVQCGLLDQVASQFSRPGQFMKVDFRDLSVDYVPASLNDHCWVAVHSGKSRELASSAYQDRVRECREGLNHLKRIHSTLTDQRDISLDMLGSDKVWDRRLHHVVTENARVEETAKALSQGDIKKVGQLLTSAHDSLRDKYEVSCEELDTLISLGQQTPGWLGGRMMGGGFGGCVLNLVERERAGEFTESILSKYKAVFPDNAAKAFAFKAVGGASVHG